VWVRVLGLCAWGGCALSGTATKQSGPAHFLHPSPFHPPKPMRVYIAGDHAFSL
jgi:hypothetical protein